MDSGFDSNFPLRFQVRLYNLKLMILTPMFHPHVFSLTLDNYIRLLLSTVLDAQAGHT